MKKIRICMWIFALMCFLMVLPEEVKAEIVEGECGTGVTWSLDTETCVLNIEGSGEVGRFRDIADYVEQIDTICFGSKITGIDVNAAQFVGYDIRSFQNVEAYSVDENNSYYSSVNGVLFNKDQSALIRYPEKRNGSYMIPNSVSCIAEYAFSGSNLLSVNIPGSVLEIQQNAFGGSKLTEVIIPDSVTSIGIDAFTYCACKTISIGNSVETMDYAFAYCENLTSVTTASDVGEKTFSNCTNLQSVKLNEGVKIIGKYAFAGCEKLNEICFPESLEEIQNAAFSGCGLESVYITKGIKTIAPSAFSGNVITGFSCDKNSMYYSTENGILFNKEKTALVKYPCGKTDTTIYEIPTGVNTIASYAFSNCTALQEIILSEGVTTIDTWAFANCKSIKNIVLPEGVELVGEGAFIGCSTLEYVVFPKSLETIGRGKGTPVFDDCDNLKKIYGYRKTVTEGYAGVYFESLDAGVTITFDSNGGKTVEMKTIYPTGAYGTLPKPKRAGYVFEGWYTKTVGGNCITSNEIVRTIVNQTLYAHWSYDTYEVTFDANGGSVANTEKTVTYTEVYGELPVPVRTGYTFVGWYTAKNGGTKVMSSSKVMTTTEQILYARWKVILPDTPKLSVKLNTYNAVKLSWSKVKGAKGYVIYCAERKNGTYKKIKTVKSNVLSFKHTNLKKGKTYYYKVAAYKVVDGKTVYSEKSKICKKYIKGKLTTPKQKKIYVNEIDNTYRISWKSIKDADKVVIYRKVDNGKYKAWKTVSAKKGSVTASLKSCKKGKKYSFILRAYYLEDGVKVYSKNSNKCSFIR